jgi:threonine/homoserine/homoserine lactone efflux protein
LGFGAGFGTLTGVLVNTSAAVLGLSDLLRASETAQALVIYAGAEYPVYLSVQTFRREDKFELAAGDGGGSLARSLLRADAIDELRLTVAPVVLGGGVTPFNGGVRR